MELAAMANHSAESKGSDSHTIRIWQVNKDRLASMQQRIADTPRILSRSAGKSSCCIFKVPQSFIDINGRCYQPHIVSVGPYHHGDSRLLMIDEHKWRFLGTLLKRMQTKGIILEDLLAAVQPLEARARECYSANINFTADEFVEILVVDGCFVIELFRKFGGLVAFEAGDPLLSLSWIYSFLRRDLIRLENQIPFFILQCLFDLTELPGEESSPSLSYLALQFFNASFQRSDEFVGKFNNVTGKHLLDFLRLSFIPEGYEEPKQRKSASPNSAVIHCISKLRRAGIRLKAVEEDSFLVIKFRRGAIEMPTITVDDFMSSFLQNCVAYEQCHRHCSKHMTTYATLLDCLINTAKDVEYLCDQNIVENYFGTDTEVARFINNLGKDVSFDVDLCYLSDLFEEVNHYYKNHWHVHWASFKYTYFNTPWSFISALAAFVLLVLTVAQTYFTVLSYVRPPN
ncbi:transmembrane protein [Perilla frutescens var. hirtella]|uniref:Transmembrane protein n=1 Tax=Perilla frutescens var. hirtella TaxID=608512 RepID=A0AAD4PG73_PERFH|nr:transmembrane protein [Perilla frutescens var. hirtella]